MTEKIISVIGMLTFVSLVIVVISMVWPAKQKDRWSDWEDMGA